MFLIALSCPPKATKALGYEKKASKDGVLPLMLS